MERLFSLGDPLRMCVSRLSRSSRRTATPCRQPGTSLGDFSRPLRYHTVRYESDYGETQFQ